MSSERAELEVLEFLLGLDALGLGNEAYAIYRRAMARAWGPGHKASLLLTKSIRRHEAGLEVPREADDEVSHLDAEVARVWSECLEEMRLLWILKGNHEEEGEAF